VVKPQFFHRRVPGSDSFKKYAAAFLNIPRSIFTSTSSFLVRANSISISVRGRRMLLTSPNLPALYAFTQVANVDGGKDSRRAASGNDSFSSITGFSEKITYVALSIVKCVLMWWLD
jgi:hypothetical protein